MKHNTSVFILIAAILLSAIPLNAQNYFADTVWTKETDQVQGFWKVKFSNNDSIIVGHGREMDIFYDAMSGNEINRIPGNTEIFYYNDNLNFIRLKKGGLLFEIFNSLNFTKIDSIDNQGNVVIGYPEINNNQRFIVAQISHGFGIWDILEKRLLKVKKINSEPNLIYYEILGAIFHCDNNKIIGQQVKTYEDPQHPGDQKFYKTFANYIVYDFNTLDSIDSYPNSRGFRLSKTCSYFVSLTGDPTYGVEIYDFNTKQLLHKLPINGPSLTGIEFSPDDKYIVTSNGPGANSLIIWEVATGNEIHRYWPSSYSAFDVSHNGLFILGVYGRRLRYFHARFSGTSIPEIPTEIKYLYPNPTTGEISINNEQSGLIKIYNSNGILRKVIESIPTENGINFNVSDLSNGEYFIILEGKETETYKLIINK